MLEEAAVLEETTSSAGDSGGDGAPSGGGALEPAPAAVPGAVADQPPAPTEARAAAPAPASPIEIEYPEETDEAENTAARPAPPAATEPEPGSATARFGTAALGRILRENPELAAAAEASPRIKAQLYQMARRSQELAEYQDALPSLSRVRKAVEAQQALAGYDRAFYGDNPAEFWEGLYRASQDADGQPTGAYERATQFLHGAFLDQLEGSGNEQLTQAAHAIREALGWGSGSSRNARSQAEGGRTSGNQATADLPPHIRQQLRQADENVRELQHLRSRLSAGEEQAKTQFLDETAIEAGRELRSFVDGLLASTGLSDYDKQNIARDFIEQVAELADQDKVHNAALEEIFARGGAQPATRVEMVARVKQWGRRNGREILEGVLKRAGAALKQRQGQRDSVRAGYRAEPAAAGSVARPLEPSAREMVKRTEQKLGRRLTDREILELA